MCNNILQQKIKLRRRKQFWTLRALAQGLRGSLSSLSLVPTTRNLTAPPTQFFHRIKWFTYILLTHFTLQNPHNIYQFAWRTCSLWTLFRKLRENAPARRITFMTTRINPSHFIRQHPCAETPFQAPSTKYISHKATHQSASCVSPNAILIQNSVSHWEVILDGCKVDR